MWLILDVLLLLALELIESHHLKGKTLKEAVIYQYRVYVSYQFQFLVMNLSLVYVLFYIYYYGVYDAWMVALAFVKIFDLLVKLYLFLGLEKRSPQALTLVESLDQMRLDGGVRYINSVLYPFMMAMGLLY